MGDGDGKLPSLADTIAAVRRELSAAQAAGQGQPIQFRTGPVELEFEVAVTRTGGGQAGVQLWVLTLGGKGELGHATTQRIKVTLQPVDPETGEDAQITDARQRAGTGRAAAVARRALAVSGDSLRLARRWEAAWGLTGTGSVSCTRRARMPRGPVRGTGWVIGWCSPPGT